MDKKLKLKDFHEEDWDFVYSKVIDWDEWRFFIENCPYKRLSTYCSLTIFIWWDIAHSSIDIDYTFYRCKDKKEALKVLNQLTEVAEKQLLSIKTFNSYNYDD